ncbi:MAG: O-antigen ligase family protein [Blastocatellia bacterium]
MSRLVLAFYLASLVLLPWTWFPPFPWLHEHAQWSDAVFAVTCVAWLIDRLRLDGLPRLRATHVALAAYFLLACASLFLASPNPQAGAPKLLGVAELCALAFITADLASRPGASRGITRAVAIASLLTAAAAAAGLLLFYGGVYTRFIGIYGELEPSPWYARVQSGTHNPNLLASFCIFAAAVVSRRDGQLGAGLRRVTLAALWITVLLTFSRGILGFVLAAAIRYANTPLRRKVAAAFAVVSILLIVSATIWKPRLNPSHPFETRFERVYSSRYQAAISSLATLVAHPLLGSGLSTNAGAYQGFPFDAHLTPLNIAATLGLPALATLSCLICLCWKGRRRPTDRALWGGFAGLAVDALAQDVEDFRHVWVMLGLVDADREAIARSGEKDELKTKAAC